MRSGIAIVGFVTRDAVSKGSSASFPSALGEQRVKELSRLFGRQEVVVVVDFRAGNWDRIHFVTQPLSEIHPSLVRLTMEETDDLIEQQLPAVLRSI